jgi:hypothetical protein
MVTRSWGSCQFWIDRTVRTNLDSMPTSKRILKDRRRRPEGDEWEPIKILMQELAYVPSSNAKSKTLQESDEHTNQQHGNDLLKVMNAAEKEWDQLDTRLARYNQNSEQMLLLKLSGGHVRPCTGYVRFRRIYPVIEPDMFGLPRNFLLNFDS